jgi:hypothetical protein
VTRREPRCHTPPSSRRRPCRREEVAPPAPPPCRGPCSSLVLVMQRCRAPVDAFAMLQNKMYTFHQYQDVYSKNLRLEKGQGRKLTGSEGLYTPSTLGRSLLRIRPPKMSFA